MTLVDNQSDLVPSMPATMKDEESIMLAAPTITASQENSQQQCDDNQNNMNNRTMSNAVGERIRVNLKQLLALYAKLKRQLVEFTEAKANEQSSYKAKCDEMSSQVRCVCEIVKLIADFNVFLCPQLMSLKLEVDSRPMQEDFDAKVQQCTALRLEFTNLTEEMAYNEKLLEQVQLELTEERKRRMEMMEKRLEERAIQTEAEIESTKEVPGFKGTARVAVLSESLSQKPSTEMPQPPTASTTIIDDSFAQVYDDNDDDDALNNHPKVLYEDELIVFKEQCTNLTAENVRLHHEVSELRANMSHFHSSWLYNFSLKYLVPVLIVFFAYLFYLLK